MSETPVRDCCSRLPRGIHKQTNPARQTQDVYSSNGCSLRGLQPCFTPPLNHRHHHHRQNNHHHHRKAAVRHGRAIAMAATMHVVLVSHEQREERLCLLQGVTSAAEVSQVLGANKPTSCAVFLRVWVIHRGMPAVSCV